MMPGGAVLPVLERFARGSPLRFDVSEKPLRPQRIKVDYLNRHVKARIDRSAAVLPAPSLD
jgi:hypothetical protein